MLCPSRIRCPMILRTVQLMCVRTYCRWATYNRRFGMLARNTDNLYVRYNWKGLEAKFVNDILCYHFSLENFKTDSKYEIIHCLSGRLLNFSKLSVVTIYNTWCDIKKLRLLWNYIYVLHMVVIINTDYFSKECKPIVLCNWNGLCSVWGRKWILCIIQMSTRSLIVPTYSVIGIVKLNEWKRTKLAERASFSVCGSVLIVFDK